MDIISNAQRAEVLIQALPYIQKYTGQDRCRQIRRQRHDQRRAEGRRSWSDIVLLSLIGVKVVLVHGGGPEITEMLQKLGKEAAVCGRPARHRRGDRGRRADGAGRQDQQDARQSIWSTKGGRAIGLSGIDGQHDRGASVQRRAARLRGRDHEGRRAPRSSTCSTRATSRSCPPSGCDTRGQRLQHQRRHRRRAHRRRAAARRASSPMTDIGGILRDKDDPGTLIPVHPYGRGARSSSRTASSAAA